VVVAARGLCALERSVGRDEPCPGAQCPLWVVERAGEGCALEDVELHLHSPDLARYLLELRHALAAAGCEAGSP
jgi:hypothetical protein